MVSCLIKAGQIYYRINHGPLTPWDGNLSSFLEMAFKRYNENNNKLVTA